MAEQSRALASSSVIYRMWVRILAWSLVTLESWSKVLYHNCFSPTSRNGYRQETGSNLPWTGILSRGIEILSSVFFPRKPDINISLMSHVGLGQTLHYLSHWLPEIVLDLTKNKTNKKTLCILDSKSCRTSGLKFGGNIHMFLLD